MILFLQSSSLWNYGTFAALSATMILIWVLIFLFTWIYMAFAFTAIGKRAKLSSPEIAWIPGIGPNIVANRVSKMHWWPWLLFIVFWVPVVGSIAAIIFAIYTIIWLWKTFEKVKRPGYWAVLSIIPIVNYVLAGIAAWGKK